MRFRYCTGVVVALVNGAVALAAIEAVQSGEVTDPAGDMKNNAQPWQDVVGGRIVRDAGTFTFSMRVATALPVDPPAASGGLGWYMWLWGVDTDPDLVPEGWPFPQNKGAAHDFIVALASDGQEYFAFVADRRPLALGQDVVITPVPCRVDGASVQVFADVDLFDDPAEFLWRCGTMTAHAHFEADGFQVTDLNDANWVPWPEQ
jgi:hypothetical protein